MSSASSFAFLPRLQGALLTALCGALLCPVAWAADIIVVTDSRHPVQAPAHARVITLDEATRIEAELAAGLPNDPTRGAALVQQRLRDGGVGLQRRIAAAYQGVADAWSLGITTLPAVVVDRRYVIYGEPDVARAVARIEAYRKETP